MRTSWRLVAFTFFYLCVTDTSLLFSLFLFLSVYVTMDDGLVGRLGIDTISGLDGWAGGWPGMAVLYV